MVEENVLLRHPGIDGVLFHGVDFIIYNLSVVAGKEQLRRHALLIEHDTQIQAIPQHFTRRPVRPYSSTKNHDTLRIGGAEALHLLRGDGRLAGIHGGFDFLFCCFRYIYIYAYDQYDGCNHQLHQQGEQPDRQASLIFPFHHSTLL